MHLISRLAMPLTVLVAFAFVGCADYVEPRGKTLHGRVTIDGKPVTAGYLLIVSENGVLTATAPLHGDGTYVVNEPPLGRVKIAVQTLMYRDRASPKEGEDKRDRDPAASGSGGIVLPPPSERGLVYQPIPEKYEDVETSGLGCVVEPGEQSFDVALTSQ